MAGGQLKHLLDPGVGRKVPPKPFNDAILLNSTKRGGVIQIEYPADLQQFQIGLGGYITVIDLTLLPENGQYPVGYAGCGPRSRPRAYRKRPPEYH